MQYRLKSVSVTAIQWDGSSKSHNAIQEINPHSDRMITSGSDIDGVMKLSVPMKALGHYKAVLLGDWVIQSDDYLVVMKGADFDKYYEEVPSKH